MEESGKQRLRLVRGSSQLAESGLHHFPIYLVSLLPPTSTTMQGWGKDQDNLWLAFRTSRP